MATRPRVLVIDDEASVRAVVCDFLRDLGCDADEADSGATGVTLVQRQRYDLVITDLKMPGMTGWEVVEAVRASVPTVPIVMISGFATEADQTRAQEAGLTFLQKPFQLAEFRDAITTALARPASAERLAPESPPKKPLSKASDEGQQEAEEGRGSG
jgi:DNA-binding response OmpR family regulator